MAGSTSSRSGLIAVLLTLLALLATCLPAGLHLEVCVNAAGDFDLLLEFCHELDSHVGHIPEKGCCHGDSDQQIECDSDLARFVICNAVAIDLVTNDGMPRSNAEYHPVSDPTDGCRAGVDLTQYFRCYYWQQPGTVHSPLDVSTVMLS